MLTSIAPRGLSNSARAVVEQAVDLLLAILRHDGLHHLRAADPARLALLTAAGKLVSPQPQELEEDRELEDLLKLLTLAEDVARHDARDRYPHGCVGDRPDLELGDLRRRAANTRRAVSTGRRVPAAPDRTMSRKEAS